MKSVFIGAAMKKYQRQHNGFFLFIRQAGHTWQLRFSFADHKIDKKINKIYEKIQVWCSVSVHYMLIRPMGVRRKKEGDAENFLPEKTTSCSKCYEGFFSSGL